MQLEVTEIDICTFILTGFVLNGHQGKILQQKKNYPQWG